MVKNDASHLEFVLSPLVNVETNLNVTAACMPRLDFILFQIVSLVIDRTSLAEKSARKDEKTLFWPPPISLLWLPNQLETNSAEITY